MTDKITYTYVDALRNNTWRSEPEESQTCLRQCARGFSERNSNDSQAGSSPICQVFPTQDTVISARLSTCRVEISSATRNPHGFVREGAELKDGLAAEWIGEIKKVWARGASSTLDLARVVSAAKNQLRRQYGQWSRLWKAEQKMPVSKSTADQLAVIGQRMGGLDSQTSENLPRGWNILFCLAGLDRGTLEQLIEQGFVHPKLTLREAKELVARLRGKPTATTRKANVRLWLRRSAEFVRDTVSDWEPNERELATEALTQLIEQIGIADGVTQRNGNALNFITRCNVLTDHPTNL